MLAIITGTRPEIIKMFPIMKQLEKEKIDYKYIHTGQHYDSKLSSRFFDELDIKYPDHSINLEKSKNYNMQIIEIKNKIGTILKNERFSSVLVQGDTNSTLGAALAAYEANISIYHIEAGLRCFDKFMQEEMNRINVDRISDVLFAPTEDSLHNLVNENVKGKIFVVGNTIMDAIRITTNKHPGKLNEYGQVRSDSSINQNGHKHYVLITIHRAENLANKEFLFNLFTSLKTSGLSYVFPIHPHTFKQFKNYNMEYLLESGNIQVIPPTGYYEFLKLVKGADFLITDSGGLQEEITSDLINKYAIILRPNTERPESIRSGHSVLLKDFNIENLIAEIKAAYIKIKTKKTPLFVPASPYGSGDSSKQIVDIIKMLHSEYITVNK